MRVTRLFVASFAFTIFAGPRLRQQVRRQPEASTIMSAPLQGSAASSPMRTIPLLPQAQGVSGSAFPRGTLLQMQRGAASVASAASAPRSVRAARDASTGGEPAWLCRQASSAAHSGGWI